MKPTFLLTFLCLSIWASAQKEAVVVGRWSDTALVGSNTYNNTYNEVWGLVVNGSEYAVIGSTAGTHFIDVATAQEVAFVAGAAQGGTIIHRDYHDYNGYLYAVSDEGNSTLQIIDFSGLPNSVSVVYDNDNLIKRSHNIFIDTATARLYALAVRTPTAYEAMAIYDISTPTAPVFLGAYNNFGGISINHVHDAYIQNDTAYLNCGYQGFFIMDFSDLNNVQSLGTMTTYPGQGYNHSGWIDTRGGYYYMGDETHNSPVKVVSISDFSDLQVVKTMDAGATHSFPIPHNQIYHNGYLFVSYYYDGLQIFDVTNPLQPTKAYYYDTYAPASQQSYEGAWGVFPFLPSGKVLVSDMQSGLYIFDLSINTNTNVTEELTTTVKVFPQPFEEVLQIEVAHTAAAEKAQIVLMDISGRIVADLGQHQIQTGENRLSLPTNPNLAKGMYLLTINGATIHVAKKVVK